MHTKIKNKTLLENIKNGLIHSLAFLFSNLVYLLVIIIYEVTNNPILHENGFLLLVFPGILNLISAPLIYNMILGKIYPKKEKETGLSNWMSGLKHYFTFVGIFLVTSLFIVPVQVILYLILNNYFSGKVFLTVFFVISFPYYLLFLGYFLYKLKYHEYDDLK